MSSCQTYNEDEHGDTKLKHYFVIKKNHPLLFGL